MGIVRIYKIILRTNLEEQGGGVYKNSSKIPQLASLQIIVLLRHTDRMCFFFSLEYYN